MSLERKRGGERKNYMLHLSFQLFSTFSHSLPNPNLRSSLALCSHGAGDVRSLWVRSMQMPPLLKLAFYQRYTVSTAITEPTEAKRLHARSLALTRLAGTLKRQRRRCRMPWWCVCMKSKNADTQTTESRAHVIKHCRGLHSRRKIHT